MDGALEQRVRLRAYEIWMAEGQGHGQAHDHWIAAELDLTRISASPAAIGKRAPAKKVAAPKSPSTRAASTKAAASKAPRATIAKDAAPKNAAPKKTKSAKAGKTVDQGSSAAPA